MRTSRELALVTVACAAAAGLALLAASRTWVVEVTVRAAPLPSVTTARTGGSLEPLLPAVALVALACAGGLLATRGTARRVVGVVMVVAGLLAVYGAAATSVRVADLTVAWSVLCMVAGLVVAASGVVTVWRGHGWPAMGTRYERAVRTPEPTDDPAQLWDAIDRGDDPTSDGPKQR